MYGGEGGIRTHGTLIRTTVFETVTLIFHELPFPRRREPEVSIIIRYTLPPRWVTKYPDYKSDPSAIAFPAARCHKVVERDSLEARFQFLRLPGLKGHWASFSPVTEPIYEVWLLPRIGLHCGLDFIQPAGKVHLIPFRNGNTVVLAASAASIPVNSPLEFTCLKALAHCCKDG